MNLQDTLILNNMLSENLLVGEPRKAITFNFEVLMEGLKVKYTINITIIPHWYLLVVL